jgi:hypothetical protein
MTGCGRHSTSRSYGISNCAPAVQSSVAKRPVLRLQLPSQERARASQERARAERAEAAYRRMTQGWRKIGPRQPTGAADEERQ